MLYFEDQNDKMPTSKILGKNAKEIFSIKSIFLLKSNLHKQHPRDYCMNCQASVLNKNNDLTKNYCHEAFFL